MIREPEVVWKKAHQILVDEGDVTYQMLEKSLQSSEIFFRKGFKDAFHFLKFNKITTLISSCGFENVIKYVFELNGIYINESDPIHIDAHILEFEEEGCGKLVRIHPETPLHHMSKRHLHKRHKILNQRKGHFFAIVVGDSEGDFSILRDHENCSVLRIGFASDHRRALIMRDEYGCDLILIGDHSEEYEVITKILQRMFVAK